MATETPLMKQYNTVKRKYPGAIVLFRVGDFYETFGEDAQITAHILNITLTKRANGTASEVALAGFPYHALDTYLPRLVRAGKRVAVCDQLEDPKLVKGIVKRGVTELVTPGVSLNDNVLDARRNNFLCALHITPKDAFGLAFLDLSTGEFFCTSGNRALAEKLIQALQPAEIVFNTEYKKLYFEIFGDPIAYYALDEWVFDFQYTYRKLIEHFGTTTLKGFGIEDYPEGIVAAGVALQYLENTEHRDIKHIASISRLDQNNYVWLDKFTVRNLELINAQHAGGVPLLDVLDKTSTPMGSRMLSRWLLMPLLDIAKINERLQIVTSLVDNQIMCEAIGQHLKSISDLERLVSKIATKRISPRELGQLRRALQHLPQVVKLLKTENNASLEKMADALNPCAFLCSELETKLKDELPAIVSAGNFIADGVNAELDHLRELLYTGKDYLVKLQARESQQTGIPSLKISYNRVFGYYLEVTNVHLSKVPQNWIRKQTLTNGERYITPELKEYEDKILRAEEEIQVIEQKMFNELVESANSFLEPLQQNARVLSGIDCLISFARVATHYNYAKPVLVDENIIDIVGGRHPVIERQLPPGEKYIPNNIRLDDTENQILVISGPNMSGKSALLRQTALIVLMAQCGSFVPAQSATIGIVDKIFTRVGASDNLSRGESTFMVEMTETAGILNNLGPRSLALMDEIGRGTSTFDGISIAWAIIEYLHNHPKYRTKTLFATHYHELNNLAEQLPRIKNFNVSVQQSNGKMIFLRELKSGGSEHSFGIQVAQMAGIPNQVVIRAQETMRHLEQSREGGNLTPPPPPIQLNIFEPNDPRWESLKQMAETIDINTLSPVEALVKLNQMINTIKGS